MFDRVAASLLLAVLAPLLAAITLLIKLDSRGPVLFHQPRVGLHGVRFSILKFRSMRHEARDVHAHRQTSRGDPRVTRVGCYLRQWSLDELPQLWNVVRGDMSLVGPRPHTEHTRAGDRDLEAIVPNYAARHVVRPGMTGWAQVNGVRGEIRVASDIEQRVHLDFEYIRNWSLFLDFRILILTVVREIWSSRAY